ncbi:cbb3-type cytochrome c oxidase subunit I [Luteolibacter ambystomatis]|uniref:Cbb3-type cytochrome c oxidase subunit I n=1 Tax=Luteolibacter ambystomatis TaxID=2824561 RepID=A0A975IY48_9BACT|nr:cbb3-type cytochrome c oxidase subunit I [Luteolibacter ambystomatis]QUE49862.1 cbb3-type cytochrome c oxidase subunit I [Luteolibacter ambystomatis]
MSQDTTNTPDKDAILRASIDRSLRHPVMFFFTSAAAWLAVSILLGLISSIKIHSPGFLSCAGWLTYGRVFPSHINTLIYGWGAQAAFGTIIWLMSRLSRQQCRAAGLILTAGHVWNFTVLCGTVGILAGFGTGMPWMEFPAFAWPVLFITYTAICVWSLVQFKVRPEGHTYVSQWYVLAAMVWFPWVFLTANVILHCMPGHPVMAAGVNAWYRSALLLLFFVPVGTGAAYYLIPKVTGRPVMSYTLAKIGFWSLAIIAPWAGMQKLAGAPLPYFLPYLGAAATILCAIPSFANAFNLISTAARSGETVVHSPTLRFTLGGLIGLATFGVACVILNLNSTLPLSQFTLSGYGFDLLGIYGFFSMVMFGAIYFIVPRITRREWLSRRLIKWHFLFSSYGLAIVVLVALFGGLMQGVGQEEFRSNWQFVAERAFPYAIFMTFAWIGILLSNIWFFLHLTLMWLRLGRRSSHPTLLLDGHHGSPHGPEGDIDNAGPGHASAAH